MTVSKKISITQLFLSFLNIFAYIFLIYKINISDLSKLKNSDSLLFSFVIIIILSIIIISTSIAQIIYCWQEKMSGLYLATGIFGIFIIIPFFNMIIIILNIIILSISSDIKKLNFEEEFKEIKFDNKKSDHSNLEE